MTDTMADHGFNNITGYATWTLFDSFKHCVENWLFVGICTRNEMNNYLMSTTFSYYILSFRTGPHVFSLPYGLKYKVFTAIGLIANKKKDLPHTIWHDQSHTRIRISDGHLLFSFKWVFVFLFTLFDPGTFSFRPNIHHAHTINSNHKRRKKNNKNNMNLSFFAVL